MDCFMLLKTFVSHMSKVIIIIIGQSSTVEHKLLPIYTIEPGLWLSPSTSCRPLFGGHSNTEPGVSHVTLVLRGWHSRTHLLQRSLVLRYTWSAYCQFANSLSYDNHFSSLLNNLIPSPIPLSFREAPTMALSMVRDLKLMD